MLNLTSAYRLVMAKLQF